MGNFINPSLPSDCIVGRFLSESKNRFLCTVEIDGAEEVCYIASSCRLDNFIDLCGKMVLLRKNKGRNSLTRYSVLGVKHKHSYILLNTSWANKAIENDLCNRRFAFVGKRIDIKKELVINGYRTDFYILASKTIVEVKSVISTSPTAVFPTVYSERTIRQLGAIETLLAEGYKACFFIVSLNPYVKEIMLLKNNECCKMLSKCIELGLILKGYSCRLLLNGKPHIESEVPIAFEQ